MSRLDDLKDAHQRYKEDRGAVRVSPSRYYTGDAVTTRRSRGLGGSTASFKNVAGRAVRNGEEKLGTVRSAHPKLANE